MAIDCSLPGSADPTAGGAAQDDLSPTQGAPRQQIITTGVMGCEPGPAGAGQHSPSLTSGPIATVNTAFLPPQVVMPITGGAQVILSSSQGSAPPPQIVTTERMGGGAQVIAPADWPYTNIAEPKGTHLCEYSRPGGDAAELVFNRTTASQHYVQSVGMKTSGVHERSPGTSPSGEQGDGTSIGRAGFLADKEFHSAFITQGPTGALLVAGKQCLLRVFVQPADIPRVSSLVLTVKKLESPFTLKGGPARAMTFPFKKFILAFNAPNGPSLGVIVPGCFFPEGGYYSISVALFSLDVRGFDVLFVHMDRFPPLSFSDTIDVRIRIVPYYQSAIGFFPGLDWEPDMIEALRRIGLIWPVRDGVAPLDADTFSGIRYFYDDANWIDWTDSREKVVAPTEAINQRLAGDHIDITCLFRWIVAAVASDGSGGRGGKIFVSGKVYRYCSVIAGDVPFSGQNFTPGVAAQEMGHTLGMEPPSAPFYTGDGVNAGHSSMTFLPPDPFHFDFNRRIVPPLGKVGDPMGFGWNEEPIGMSTADWDFMLIKELPTLEGNITGSATHPFSCTLRSSGSHPGGNYPFVPNTPVWPVGSRADGPLWQIQGGRPHPIVGPGDPILSEPGAVGDYLKRTGVSALQDSEYLEVAPDLRKRRGR